jgi:hypothetical protein
LSLVVNNSRFLILPKRSVQVQVSPIRAGVLTIDTSGAGW